MCGGGGAIGDVVDVNGVAIGYALDVNGREWWCNRLCGER